MKHKIFKDFSFDFFSQRLTNTEVIQVFNELYTLHWQLDSWDEVKFFLENNNVSVHARKKILTECLLKLDCDVRPDTLMILFYLLENKQFQRLGYFINVLKLYYAQEKNLMMVEVVSRFDIGDVNLKVYKSSLEFLYGKEVGYIFKIDPSLLGGFKLRWYNGELDLTVRRKLSRIRALISMGK